MPNYITFELAMNSLLVTHTHTHIHAHTHTHTHTHTCSRTQLMHGMRVVTHLKIVIRLLCTYYNLDTMGQFLLFTLCQSIPDQYYCRLENLYLLETVININFSNLKNLYACRIKIKHKCTHQLLSFKS